MSDAIRLGGIRVWGRHGANPGERETAQAFDLAVELEVDLRAAQVSDDLALTIDYAALHARIVRVVEATSFALLEALAGAVLAEIFSDARVRGATVTIAKPELLAGATPAVTLRRLNPAAW